MAFKKFIKLSLGLFCVFLLQAGLSACSGDNAKSPTAEKTESTAVIPTKSPTVSLDLNKLDQLANAQLYDDAINYIRAQKPLSEEVANWLKTKSEEGHVPLQLELSSHLVDSNSEVALQWFSIGHLGLKIDSSVCSDSKAVRNSINQIISGHRASTLFRKSPEALNKAVEYSLNWYQEHPVRPSPAWACGYGQETAPEEIKMLPEDKWEDARSEVFEKSKMLHERIKLKLSDSPQKD